MGIRMGIIGFGYMGKWHLAHAPLVEGVTVTAAYDVDAERVAQRGEEAAGVHGVVLVAAVLPQAVPQMRRLLHEIPSAGQRQQIRPHVCSAG